MLAAAPDRNAVQLESEDWMLGGHAVKQESASESEPVSRKAIISLDSTSQDAERLFRETIVSIDSVPGNQVQGISPLYHVSHFDGPDAMSAVIQIETKLPPADLIAVLGSIESVHDLAVDLDLVDMEGVTSDEPNCSIPWPSARNHASVLAPWLDMDRMLLWAATRWPSFWPWHRMPDRSDCYRTTGYCRTVELMAEPVTNGRLETRR